MEPREPIEPTVRRATDPRTDATLSAQADSALPTLIRGDSVAPAEPAPLPPGGRPFGRYRLERELGRGGMGIVWKAWDPELSRHVALKQILSQGNADSETVERFVREARLAAKLRHPHILSVHDVGVQDGQHYFTTDYVEGMSLDEVTPVPIPPRQAVTWARAIAEALAYAHEHDVVHRDVKPSNVLLDGDLKPYVMDFGLAKEVGASRAGAAPLTLSGAILGTPRYMSPEQADGVTERIGPATDQFSLGVVLHEMLTGRPLFDGEGIMDVLRGVAALEAPAPSRLTKGIHRDIDTICLKLLEKKPERRYPSMREAAADLGRFLDGAPIEARPPGPIERLARFAARRRVLVGIAAVALIASAAAWVWSDRSRKAQQASTERALSAEEALRKARLVTAVVRRWERIQPASLQLEAIHYDSGRTAAEKRAAAAAPWETISVFLRETPEDPTSRSVASAYAGFARCLAGYPDEGLRMIRVDSRLDPDVPHGIVMEAAILIENWGAHLPSLITRRSAGGVLHSMPPTTTTEAKRWEADALGLLERLGASRVWGRETAEDCRAAVEALPAWTRGDYPAAEERLTRALASADLAPAHGELRVFRSIVRYQRNDPEGAGRDLDALLAIRPRDQRLWTFSGQATCERADRESSAGRDPRPLLQDAIQRFERALAYPTQVGHVRNQRGFALRSIGEWEADHGGDPIPHLERAIEDFSAAAEAPAERSMALAARAAAFRERARWAVTLGQAPDEWVRRAEADIDEAVHLSDRSDDALRDRALLHWTVALWELGADPSPRLARALDDLNEAMEKTADPPAIRSIRGLVYQSLGDREASSGKDPSGTWRRSVEDYDAILGERSDAHTSLRNRGIVWLHQGRWEADRGIDPKSSFDRAHEDLTRSLELNPDPENTRAALSNLWLARAEWESNHDLDPRDSLDRALGEMEEVLRRHSGTPATRNSLAAVLLRRGAAEDLRNGNGMPYIERGIQTLDEILLERPDMRTARLNRAAAHQIVGSARQAKGEDPTDSYGRAIQDYNRLLGDDHEDVAFYFNRAECHASLARWQSSGGRGADALASVTRALADYDKAIEFNPRYWQALDQRGAAYEAIGELERALADYEMAQSIRPGNPQVQRRLERVRTKLGK